MHLPDKTLYFKTALQSQSRDLFCSQTDSRIFIRHLQLEDVNGCFINSNAFIALYVDSIWQLPNCNYSLKTFLYVLNFDPQWQLRLSLWGTILPLMQHFSLSLPSVRVASFTASLLSQWFNSPTGINTSNWVRRLHVSSCSYMILSQHNRSKNAALLSGIFKCKPAWRSLNSGLCRPRAARTAIMVMRAHQKTIPLRSDVRD